jgi:hypothetical protein
MVPGLAVAPASAIGSVNARLAALFGDVTNDSDLSALAVMPADRANYRPRGDEAQVVIGSDGDNLRGGDWIVSGFGTAEDAGPSDMTGGFVDTGLAPAVADEGVDADLLW